MIKKMGSERLLIFFSFIFYVSEEAVKNLFVSNCDGLKVWLLTFA